MVGAVGRRGCVVLVGLGVAGCGSEESALIASHALDAGPPAPTTTATSPAPVPVPDASTKSDGGGAKACFGACGGDPTGLWRLESSCFADLTGGCKTGASSVKFEVTSPSGLMLFSGLNLSSQLANVTKVSTHFTAECAARSSVKAPSVSTCAAVAQGVADTKLAAGSTISDNSCVYSSTDHACDCRFVSTTDVTTLDATYSRSGNSLTYRTPAFSESLEYCVDGDTLTFRPTIVHDAGIDLAYIFRKETPTCQAKAVFCDGDAVYRCDDFGTARTLHRTCAPGESCAAGACNTPACTPSAPACNGKPPTVAVPVNDAGSTATPPLDASPPDASAP